MFDTHVTVVGTAVNTPEKRVTGTNALVASFKVASRSRRFDRETEQWVDGSSFKVRVNCWRRLGEFVAGSIVAGDPVVVYGRIVTKEWKTEEGELRRAYAIEAETVGHDLNRGRSTFQRWRPEPFGLVVEDPDEEARVDGGLERRTEAASPAEEFASAGFGAADAGGLTDDDALAMLTSFDPAGGDGEGGDGDGEDGGDGEGSGSGGGRKRRGRQPVPA